MNPLRIAALAATALLAGCDTYHYLSGTLQEDARRPVQAVKQYEKFLASRPKDPRACEVRLRAAELYRTVFGRCGEARAHYEAAARDFPKLTACLERAKTGLLRCPDYFPTDAGRTWVYVDSASRGQAMRLEWEARASSGSVGSISSALYAGDKRILTKTEYYQKADWAVWRVDKDGREAILRYPYNEAQSWSAKRGKSKVEYLVVSASTTVTAAAGTFSGCLKIREKDSAFKGSWRYDYYCPGVGRVKTTIGGPGFENPNTELSRFDGDLVK
ncbi:MAG: tetratricopeptide repeat protein [Elusimicrobia bacterium]|nr:tetratricopeptide repeat protein [Elusimicrobiota bacterium]